MSALTASRLALSIGFAVGLLLAAAAWKVFWRWYDERQRNQLRIANVRARAHCITPSFNNGDTP